MLAQALSKPFITRSEPTRVGSNGLVDLLSFIGISGNSKVVNQNHALTLSAFYNGITIICNDYAKLPKGVYQKTKDGNGRNALTNHPVKYLIDKRPNQYMTAYLFDTIMLMSAILKGNAFAEIDRSNYSAKPIALQFIDQDKTPVEVYKHQEKLFYKFDGRTVPAENMLHIPGFSFNGLIGINVIQHAARSLGTALSSENFAADYYDKKAIGTGVVTAQKKMDDTAKTRYSNAFTAALQGNTNWKVPVLDEGNTFTPIKITAQEAQFLLSSKHGINEVARWLNINPVKLKNLEDTNNSITEALDRQHVNDSILPWAIKFQQEYDTKLFSKADQQNGIYTKFNTESLLTADKTAQADYWSKLIFAGVYTRNEVRALLERNPIEGLSDPLTPVNTQTMEQIDKKLEELNKNLQNAGK